MKIRNNRIKIFKKLQPVALLLVASMTLFHCSSKPKFDPVKNDIYGDMQNRKKKLADKKIISEIGIGESLKFQIGIDKAELDARAKLSRSLETKVTTLQKKFQEEVGGDLADHFSETVKSISDQIIRGTSISETHFEQNSEGNYRVYSLIILDADLYAKALAEQLSAQKALQDRFRATVAYRELNDEAKAFQEWKQKEAGK